MIENEKIDKLRGIFLRTQTQFAEVVRELDADLKRMRENEKIPYEIINKRDEQIETLISFNNKADSLLEGYKYAMLNLQCEIDLHREVLAEEIKLGMDFLIVMRNMLNRKKNSSPVVGTTFRAEPEDNDDKSSP